VKVVAFNGSAIKDGNTAMLIRRVLQVLEAEGIEVVSGKTMRANILPKTKIEIIVEDKDVKDVTGIIIKTAGTIGDGKIFASTIDEVIRIRTGEKDSDAI